MTDPTKTVPLDAFVLLTCQAWVVAMYPIAAYLMIDRSNFGDGLEGLAALIKAAALGALILIPLIIVTCIVIWQQRGNTAKGKCATQIAMQCALIVMIGRAFLSLGYL